MNPGEEYAAEAQERWGHTDAYQESAKRTAKFGASDWAAVEADNAAVIAAFLSAMPLGPESAEARAAAELHRSAIERFYPCSHEMQINLAEMYVADARFTEYYDKHAAGLAAFVRDAIIYNAQSQSVGING